MNKFFSNYDLVSHMLNCDPSVYYSTKRINSTCLSLCSLKQHKRLPAALIIQRYWKKYKTIKRKYTWDDGRFVLLEPYKNTWIFALDENRLNIGDPQNILTIATGAKMRDVLEEMINDVDHLECRWKHIQKLNSYKFQKIVLQEMQKLH